MRGKYGTRRFDYYNPWGDFGKPEEVGVLPCDKDYELGTPNLERKENLTFVASSSSLKECLVLRLKWRPDKARRVATTVSRLSLTLEGQVYEFAEVDTYEPAESHLRAGRITQYGARNLKVFVSSPYRRLRIVFNGLMRQSVTGARVFVKLSCVLNPLSEIYDFHDLPSKDLVHHDRHEQRLKFSGEYLLIKGSGRRSQKTFSLFGWQARHFLGSPTSRDEVETARLYVQASNGQAFQIGVRRAPEAKQLKPFGYTAFDIWPLIRAMKAPYKLDAKLDSSLDKCKLEVSGQKCTFECQAERYLGEWFRVEMNGKPGWAWLSLDDELAEGGDELECVARQRSERELAIELGKVCAPAPSLDAAAHTSLVVSIDQACCRSSELVGAKAASLAQLVEFARANESGGFEVPFAFVLTRRAYELVLAENAHLGRAIGELARFAGERGAAAPAELRAECAKLEELVRGSRVPAALADELWSRLSARHADLASGGPLLAVRSSSWGEDEDDMSAAGQLATVLNVRPRPEELAAALMACFASKFSSENIEYKRQHGQPLDMPMAVVVQEMVQCDRAGVMFTCDPTTGDESQLTITANYGLGESVVSAQADPDSIRVRLVEVEAQGQEAEERLEIEEVSVGQKKVVIEADGGSAGQQDKSKCCLGDEEILRLARCGRALSRYFWSQRRDIEWGFLEGRLFLFQARPVTGLEALTQEELEHESERPQSGERACYTRANLGEIAPYALRPLSQTYFWFPLNTIALAVVSKYNSDMIYVPQSCVDMYFENFHPFLNMRCSVLLSLAVEEKSVLSKSMEIGIFGRELGPMPEVYESSRGFNKPRNILLGFKCALLTLPLRLAPKRIIMREYPRIRRLRADVRALKLAEGYEDNKLLALYKQMEAGQRLMRPAWGNHIHLVVMASNANVELSLVLSQYIKDPLQLSAATNKFLAISPDVVSAEIPRRVRDMAKLVGGEEARLRLAGMSSEEALEFLQGEGASPELRAAFQDFMANFGHRTYNEFELETCAWREEPTRVAEMIQKNCAAGGPAGPASPAAKERPQTIGEVIKSLGVELKLKDRLLVKHLLAPKSQLMLAMRERTKDLLVMHADVLREATRVLAAELERQLRLPDRNLFYYLMYEEVRPLVEDHQPRIVMQALRRRQLFKRVFGEPWKFDEIIWEVVPNHLKPRKELDEAVAQAPRLFGTPASSGKVQGRVCLLSGYRELDRVRPGCILVTHSTDIAFSPVFPLISGIITEVGGLISHGAVVAREYGLPSVIGIPDVMMILQDGEEILLDADNGAIVRLSKTNAASE